jgi:hypothetical protein
MICDGWRGKKFTTFQNNKISHFLIIKKAEHNAKI